MQTKLKHVFLGVLLTCAASQVFADNIPINAQKPNADPLATCVNAGNISCLFQNLKPYNNNPNTDGAYFHCTPLNSSKKFVMVDVDTLITGFNSQGSLRGDVSDLTKYSFGAYLDPEHNQPWDVGRVTAIDQNNDLIPCTAGTGGLPVHPGAPGIPSN